MDVSQTSNLEQYFYFFMFRKVSEFAERWFYFCITTRKDSQAGASVTLVQCTKFQSFIYLIIISTD